MTRLHRSSVTILCPLLLFACVGTLTYAADDAGQLRARVEEAHELTRQAREYLLQGRYADANAAARLANSIIQALPDDTAERLRILRVNPERHVRREPPPFAEVERVQRTPPPGLREAAIRGIPVLSVDVTPNTMHVYDSLRNPWNGDVVYLFQEIRNDAVRASGTLIAAIEIVRPRTLQPFDLRAMEMRVNGDRDRYGFPDDTVRRERDGRQYRETVSIPVDDDTRRFISRAIDAGFFEIVLEGNEDRLRIRFGESEREGVRRMLEWTDSAP